VRRQIVGRHVKRIVAEYEKEKAFQGNQGFFHWRRFFVADFAREKVKNNAENVENNGE
jgi:hypothetical protein